MADWKLPRPDGPVHTWSNQFLRKRRLREAQICGSTHTSKEWRALLHYCGKCVRCGAWESGKKNGGLQKDHIVPLSRWGKDTIENLQPLCGPCHAAKGVKPWPDMRPAGWREHVRKDGT